MKSAENEEMKNLCTGVSAGKLIKYQLNLFSGLMLKREKARVQEEEESTLTACTRDN